MRCGTENKIGTRYGSFDKSDIYRAYLAEELLVGTISYFGSVKEMERHATNDSTCHIFSRPIYFTP